MSKTRLLHGQGLGAVRGERVLFRDVSVSAHSGELILLRGANGSGKTTLLRQLAGLSETQAGTIERAGLHDAFVAIAGEAAAKQLEADAAGDQT